MKKILLLISKIKISLMKDNLDNLIEELRTEKMVNLQLVNQAKQKQEIKGLDQVKADIEKLIESDSAIKWKVGENNKAKDQTKPSEKKYEFREKV